MTQATVAGSPEPAAPPRRSLLDRAASHARALIERGVGAKLSVLRQYPPRELRLPPHYTRPSESRSSLRFSVVTPSYNQGRFIERTIRSVLGQEYPNLEYVVQDGASRDETPAVLERYRGRLAHCESARDGGQAQAINRGFRRAGGDVLAYLNSDDLLLPGAVAYVADYFDRHPEIDVVYGHRVVIDEADAEVGRWVLPPHDADTLTWFDYVPQETLFWRRGIWDKVGGGLDESFQFALDWDLLLRFHSAGARVARLPRFLGAFRVHDAQKIAAWWDNVGVPETNRLLERCHGRPVSTKERFARIFPYLCRHGLYHKLYRLGILSY